MKLKEAALYIDMPCGGFGDIKRALLGDQEVCVKVLRIFPKSEVVKILKVSGDVSPNYLTANRTPTQEFALEAVIWFQLKHPNVLPLYGVAHMGDSRDDERCLASPWMNSGNIVQFLRMAPTTECSLLVSKILFCTSMETTHRNTQILDIAEGLNFLHSFRPSVIHGDLKGVSCPISSLN
jgi:hypothetical protein